MRQIILFASFVIVGVIAIEAQDLERVLSNAERQAQFYRENFANLTAKEKKLSEIFDAAGNALQRRETESNLIIYQTKNEPFARVEYRALIKINGRQIAETEKMTADFFADLLRSASAQEELQKINAKTLAKDETLAASNLTLIQAPILAEHLRPYFDFKLIGETEGKYIVEYGQKSKCPYVAVNAVAVDDGKISLAFGVSLPASAREFNEKLYGTLWIDARTNQIWREERALSLQPSDSAVALEVFRAAFQYQKGARTILEPKEIQLTSYIIKKKGDEYRVKKESRLSFEYSDFAGDNVTVKVSGIGETIIVEKD